MVRSHIITLSLLDSSDHLVLLDHQLRFDWFSVAHN